MEFLERARQVLVDALPELHDKLAAQESSQWNHGDHGTEAIEWFRLSGGPGLLIPEDLGGAGLTAVEAVRLQRGLGSIDPALAVATTMHHFSVATLLEIVDSGLESILLEGIARENLIVASGFAEGSPRSGLLSPTTTGVEANGTITLNGRKRPCSLSRSMDLLAASADIGGRMAVVMIPAGLAGIEIVDCWRSPVLAATQSFEVRLHDVQIPAKMVSYADDTELLDRAQIGGFTWFIALMTASYVGAASILLNQAVARNDESIAEELALLTSQLETVMAAVESVARLLEEPERDEPLLARAMMVKTTADRVIGDVGLDAFRLLGGGAFMTRELLPLQLATTQAAGFHPPNRAAAARAIADWMAGQPLMLD